MKKPLSTAQLVILLFFCRHYSLLTYTNSEQALETSLYAIVIADIINLLFLIPVFLLLKKIIHVTLWQSLKIFLHF